MSDCIARVGAAGVVPVVELPDGADPVALVDALLAGGVDCIEITLRTAGGGGGDRGDPGQRPGCAGCGRDGAHHRSGDGGGRQRCESWWRQVIQRTWSGGRPVTACRSCPGEHAHQIQMGWRTASTRSSSSRRRPPEGRRTWRRWRGRIRRSCCADRRDRCREPGALPRTPERPRMRRELDGEPAAARGRRPRGVRTLTLEACAVVQRARGHWPPGSRRLGQSSSIERCLPTRPTASGTPACRPRPTIRRRRRSTGRPARRMDGSDRSRASSRSQAKIEEAADCDVGLLTERTIDDEDALAVQLGAIGEVASLERIERLIGHLRSVRGAPQQHHREYVEGVRDIGVAYHRPTVAGTARARQWRLMWRSTWPRPRAQVPAVMGGRDGIDRESGAGAASQSTYALPAPQSTA